MSGLQQFFRVYGHMQAPAGSGLTAGGRRKTGPVGYN